MGRIPDHDVPSEDARSGGVKELVRRAGAEAGFCAVGVARAGRLDSEASHLGAWIEAGCHGSMAWMARETERRLDPCRLLPGARSVLVGAVYYRHEGDAGAPRPGTPTDHPCGAHGEPALRISCYARGEDYHRVVGEALDSWAGAIRMSVPDLRWKAVCDTSAAMEKAWAVKAGVGWLGQNGCLIHPACGSWVFLGMLITNLDLDPDEPIPDRCGRCRRCIDACPTGAIVQPHVVDSRLCISYRTLEHRGPFPPDWGPQPVADWLAGCDICQEVCPWNARAAGKASPRFRPRAGLACAGASEWLEMGDEAIAALLRGTALSRVKPADMRRNARAARSRPQHR